MKQDVKYERLRPNNWKTGYRLLEELTVYKGAYVAGHPVLVTLRLFPGTKINLSPNNGGKNRANVAQVISIRSRNGKRFKTATSSHNDDFVYTVGHIVHPTRAWRPGAVCAAGIHFYRDKRDAWRFVNGYL